VPVPGCAAAAQNTLAKIPWAQLRLAPDQAWPLSRGRGVTVAIVDSGVDATAPALAGRVSTGVDVPAGKGQGNTDCLGHGTAMAGIIVAQPRPGSGFVGIAPEATIMPIRVDLARGAPNPAQVATAFQVAVSAGASVIAVPGPLDLSDPVVGKAADDAVAHNVVLVVAGDPTGRNLTAKPGVLRVGAVAADDRLTAMYPPGSVDVLAPGDGVVSLSANGSGEIEGSGTDFAVPFVAGLAALVRSASPQLSAQITTGHIESTADRRSGTSPDPAYGWGVINLTAAVNASLRDDAASAGGKINVGGLGTPATLAILLACALVVAGVGWQLRRVVVRRRGHDGPSSGTAG
jgi:subtilisin family serine protease